MNLRLEFLLSVFYWAHFKTQLLEKVMAHRELIGTPSCLSVSIVRSNKTTRESLEKHKTAPAQGKTPGDRNVKLHQGHISQWEMLEAEVTASFSSTNWLNRETKVHFPSNSRWLQSGHLLHFEYMFRQKKPNSWFFFFLLPLFIYLFATD